MSVSQLLRTGRRAAGLTLEELSERSGISVRAIGDLERGTSRGPHARTVAALAAGLDLAVVDRAALLAAAAAARQRRYGPTSSGWLPLPPDTPDFTGRDAELAALREATATGSPAVIISGAGGLGKTALAVRAARQVPDRVVDVRFFLDLRGVAARPLDPGVALARLLCALGVGDGAIPPETDDRAALYHRLMAQRRVLVVLDDAHSEAQVRPMLPADGSGVVLITSRRALTGLGGRSRVALGPMTDADASRMLHAVVDEHEHGHDVEQLRTVARRCGHFPLALRIAGNRLSSRPDWTMATLADQLAARESRLDRLTAGDLQIRATFERSYQQLPRPAQLLFRRLALLAGPDLCVAAAAVVAALPERRAEQLLEELVELGLLVPAGDRYALHDLIRIYAHDRLVGQDDPTERLAAATRLRDWLRARPSPAGASTPSR